jgi:hypothetical protein
MNHRIAPLTKRTWNSRLSVWIGSRHLVALLVRNRRVIWRAEATFDSNEKIGSVLLATLAGAPPSLLDRARVTAVLGPSAAQDRRIDGLPLTRNLTILRSVVVQAGARYFPVPHGDSVTIGSLQRIGPGSVWAVAFDSQVVASLVLACKSANLSLEYVVPAAAAFMACVGEQQKRLRGNPAEQRLQLADGPIVLDLVASGGVLISSRRSWAEGTKNSEFIPTINGVGFGSETQELMRTDPMTLLAYAGTFVNGESLAYEPRRDQANHEGFHAIRFIALGVLAAAAVTWCLLAPDLARNVRAAQMRRDLIQIRPLYDSASKLMSQVTRMDTSAAIYAAFRAHRSLAVDRYREIAAALPTGAAIVSVHLDTLDGSATIATTDASAVLRSLRGIKGLRRIAFDGAVNHQRTTAGSLQQFTVILGWADSVPPQTEPR